MTSTTATKNILKNSLGAKMNLDTFKAFTQKVSTQEFVKKPMNENLTHSSPCKFVISDFENTGKYGTCYKKECFHAHSLQQWKPARCNFNGNCHNEKCTFYHPILESIDMWCERTNSQIPNLPVSLPEVKQPKHLLIPSQINMKKIRAVQEELNTPPKSPQNHPNHLENVEDLFTDNLGPPTILPERNIKEVTPVIRCSTQELLMFAIQECVSHGIFTLDAQLSDLPNQIKNKHIVVTVPTEKIAQFTIKTFFQMGHFDIDIRVSE